MTGYHYSRPRTPQPLPGGPSAARRARRTAWCRTHWLEVLIAGCASTATAAALLQWFA